MENNLFEKYKKGKEKLIIKQTVIQEEREIFVFFLFF